MAQLSAHICANDIGSRYSFTKAQKGWHMRVMIIAAAAAFLLASASAFAQFQGPGAPNVTTVAEAKQAPDDTAVVLTGRITAKVRADNYSFEDKTGKIEVDIDEKLWQGRKVTPETTIRITGEVDRESWGVEIDVDSFEIVTPDASTKKGGSGKP